MEVMRTRYGEAMRRRLYVDRKAKASPMLSTLMRDKGWEECASLPHAPGCHCFNCFNCFNFPTALSVAKVTNSHSKSKSLF